MASEKTSPISAIVSYMRQTPMYRSMLYLLLSFLGLGVGLSLFDVLPYDPLDISFASVYLMAVCWTGSLLLGKLFRAKPNPESSFITGAILALIFGPVAFFDNIIMLSFLGLTAAASKYLLVWRGNHVFNPAALAAVATVLVFDVGSSWWVGSIYLVVFVVIGGLYESMYQVHRMHLMSSFLLAYALFFVGKALFGGVGVVDAADSLWTTLLYSPILFFTLVMLVEPLTSPADRNKRIVYGILTAALVVFLPELLPRAPYTLELSLLIGNLFAALSGNQGRLLLTLKKREQLTDNITAFWFGASPERQFVSGQYLHYTLPHQHSDSRGSRRFFTIASSPTEHDILLTTKFAPKSSSFKRALLALRVGSELAASRPEGEFVMPRDTGQPLVFIAGGIGVTPFRSMMKYLLDTRQSRPITLIYAARNKDELVFREIFDTAEKQLHVNIVYVLDNPPAHWKDPKGPITGELITQYAPDKNALYFVSGPEPMVRSLISQLQAAGVARSNIKHDYFPGY